MEEGFRLIKRVDITVASPNVDLHYGPYTSVAEANSEIVLGLRAVGKVVGIVSGTEVLDYHWRNGITDADLVQKSSVTEIEKATWNGKQDKSGNDGIRYVLFNGGLVQQIDTNTNVINTDLTQTSNRVHNLGTKILRFFNGIFQVPALTFDETTADSLPNKDWTDGIKRYFTNNLGINKTFAFEEDIQVKITTSSNITSNTLSSVNALKQHGKNVQIANGASNINYTLEITSDSKFIASYIKLGTGVVTFKAGTGATLVQTDYTDKMNGGVGSYATVTRDGNTFYLRIYNS